MLHDWPEHCNGVLVLHYTQARYTSRRHKEATDAADIRRGNVEAYGMARLLADLGWPFAK